jgi:hypothetical protein
MSKYCQDGKLSLLLLSNLFLSGENFFVPFEFYFIFPIYRTSLQLAKRKRH